MYFWKNIANFVNMKSDITFLSERKQRDLHELVALIREEIKDVVMIILLRQLCEEYLRRSATSGTISACATYYMSDYDIAGRYAAGGSESGSATVVRTDQGALSAMSKKRPFQHPSAASSTKVSTKLQPCPVESPLLRDGDQARRNNALRFGERISWHGARS